MIAWLRRMMDPWVYGTCRGHVARRHRRTGEVEFVLWKAGEHGHSVDFWIGMDPYWWDQFVPGAAP